MVLGVVLLVLLASTLLGIVIVPAVLALAPAKDLPRAKAAELLRGGLVIGVLERLAITGGLLAGRPEVVGIVLAIKGLGRYPELRNAATVAAAPPADGRGTSTSSSAEGSGPAVASAPTQPADPDIGAAVSERFIIGTLASYVWAGACGLAGLCAIVRWG